MTDFEQKQKDINQEIAEKLKEYDIEQNRRMAAIAYPVLAILATVACWLIAVYLQVVM